MGGHAAKVAKEDIEKIQVVKQLAGLILLITGIQNQALLIKKNNF